MMDQGVRAGFIILVCGIIGMLLAYLESEFYSNGWLINLYLTDASQLPGLMIVTVFLWLLIGFVIAAFTQR